MSKKLTRKMRKMMKLGKKNPSDNSFSKVSEEKKENLTEPLVSEEKNLDPRGRETKKALPKTKIESEDDKKYKDIYSHLKTVFTTSLFCIVLLFFLYYMEERNHWLEGVNEYIKNFLNNLDWKL